MKKLRKIIAALLAALMLTASATACSLKPQQSEPDDTTPIPERYSLIDEGRVGAPCSQHQTGMCWSYACTAVAESAILTDKLTEADGLNLSEAHLCSYMYQFKNEMQDESRDGLYLPGDSKANMALPYYIGGNCEIAFGMYGNGSGLANEADLPYFGTDAGEMKESFQSMYDLTHSGEVTEQDGDWLLTGIYNYQDCSIEDIKRAIMREGAMAVGMQAGADGVCINPDGLYTYYSGATKETFMGNHAVAIIGWDDTFSKDNFSSKLRPQNDGAWIIRDSTNFLSGKYGIVYISYDEFLIGFTTVKMSHRSDYGDVLHYDMLALDSVKGENGTTVANVFTVDRNCALKAAGIYALAHQPVSVKVYVNPDEGKPDSGKCAATVETTIRTMGYHVLDLDKLCELSAGDTFSIVAEYKSVKGDETLGGAPVEGTTSLDVVFNKQIESYITSGKGESFIKNGKEWLDTYDEATAKVFGKDAKLNNVGIRALLAND